MVGDDTVRANVLANDVGRAAEPVWGMNYGLLLATSQTIVETMTSRFIALPVGQGDAFLLERSGKRVLVDGGKSRKAIIELLAQWKVEHLDVIVCTHNDQDHAEGIAGLLEAEAFSVGEVWLPGRWSQRIIDLCRPDHAFFEELAADLEKSGASDLETASLSSAPEGTRDRDIVEDEERVVAAIENTADEFRGPWSLPSRSPLRWSHWNLWIECISAAERIRTIARGARNLGARLRWFDYQQFRESQKAGGGRPGFLEPVNAVEITPRIVKSIGAFDYLRLSLANRESLVFQAPLGDEPSTLFSADSDLSFPLSRARGAIATAPHHGSESNRDAYDRVEAVSEGVTWVRSDGRFQIRPGASFLERQARAYCTRCRGGTGRGMAVVAESKGADAWHFSSDGSCHCDH